METLVELKNMIERIFICMPMIIKLLPSVFSVSYVYSIIAIELYNTSTNKYVSDPYSPYSTPDYYCDFSSFYSAMLVFF